MTQRQGADDTNPTRSWALRTRRGHPKSVAILKAPFGGVGNFAQLAGSDFSSSDFFAIRRLHRSRAHLTPTPPLTKPPRKPAQSLLTGLSLGADGGSQDTQGKCQLAENLPAIRDVQDMFTDMVKKLPELGAFIKKLGRPLRVATMCSGTESPLLALDKIGNACEHVYGAKLNVDHVFSCEIEPFKQAYIERNFAPPILFRTYFWAFPKS